MRNVIIRAISSLAFGIAVTSTLSASATTSQISGPVADLKIQSQTSGSSFFTLKWSGTVGKCNPELPSGRVMALLPDDDRGKAMISVVLAALLSGKSVVAEISDQGATASTYCYANFVQISP